MDTLWQGDKLSKDFYFNNVFQYLLKSSATTFLR